MALPASGAISLGAVNTELGVSATAARSLNDSTTRALFGVASGGISLSNGYGKANQFSFTISSNQTNANLRTLAVNAGWNQSSKVVATINGGVYISSNSTGTPALTVNGSFPGGVELVNNGIIVGRGGNGGAGATADPYSYTDGSPGASGGLALAVSVPLSLNNANTIAGGGGGGGGGGMAVFDLGCGYLLLGGGGGGGGRSSAAANSSGGAAGGGGSTPPGAGGTGTVSSAGSGGNGLNAYGRSSGAGGSGGGWGSSGSTGTGGSTTSGGSGGTGGGAITGNGNITWVTTGTRLGGIS